MVLLRQIKGPYLDSTWEQYIKLNNVYQFIFCSKVIFWIPLRIFCLCIWKCFTLNLLRYSRHSSFYVNIWVRTARTIGMTCAYVSNCNVIHQHWFLVTIAYKSKYRIIRQMIMFVILSTDEEVDFPACITCHMAKGGGVCIQGEWVCIHGGVGLHSGKGFCT